MGSDSWRGVHTSIRPQLTTSEVNNSTRKAVGFHANLTFPPASSQTLFMMARLPNLEQATNHKGILKRPGGSEAATSSPGGKVPQWGLPTGGLRPRLGPSRCGRPPDTRGCPLGACSSFTLCLGDHLTWKSPFQPIGHREKEVFSFSK